jgi:outer membrane protein assembly factor BamE
MRLLFTLALTLSLTTGCNLVYKQNIQQGNAIEQEDLDKLRIGMTRNQVAFLLGTPAIRDPFHQDRWDYVSTFSRRGEEAVMRKVTLYFENGVLSEMIGVEGDMFIFEEEEPAEPETANEEIGVPPETDQGTPVDVAPLAAPAAEFPESSEAVAEVIDEPERAALAVTPEPASAGSDDWSIQLGAFDSTENAQGVVDRLEAAGIDAEITEQPSTESGVRYLVRKHGIGSRSEAERLLEEIASGLGINGFLVPPGG